MAAAFQADIVSLAMANTDFRRVVATGEHAQVVLMCIPPGGEIGDEAHQVDQLLMFLTGEGIARVDGKHSPIAPGTVTFVPAGTRHNFLNTGDVDLKLYTVYAPPQHAPDTVHRTRAEAVAAEAAADEAETTSVGAPDPVAKPMRSPAGEAIRS